MKRRSLVLTLALLAAMPLHAPRPANAHTNACVTTFAVMTLSEPFGSPLSTSVTAGFTIDTVITQCATNDTHAFQGTVTGTCGFASGTGTLNGHHSFAFTIQGEVMVITGEFSGAAHWTEDVTDFGRCENATATRFLMTGAWAGL